MSINPLSIPRCPKILERYPKTQDRSLKAWNAADELLVEAFNSLYSKHSISQPIKCLIINDQFGYLTVSLNQYSPTYWTDSYLSQQAISNNLQKNCLNTIQSIQFKADYLLEDNALELANRSDNAFFDFVLLRIPKHNSLLELQLSLIKPLINQHTKIIAGGMTKEIHNSNIKIFETIIGKTTTSLAKKKARLIYSQLASNQTQAINLKMYFLAEYRLTIYGLPGVFSREKLDIGTQVILNYLPQINAGDKVIDLACGNGIIGAIIAKKQPNCEVHLTDESQLAVESSQLTFAKNNLNNGYFYQTDGLKGLPHNSFDHVLCNPPFHQQNTQTTDIAQSMFKQAAMCLKPNGELRVVANRHLKYQSMLKQYFNQVSAISKDDKFTVWLAQSKKQIYI